MRIKAEKYSCQNNFKFCLILLVLSILLAKGCKQSNNKITEHPFYISNNQRFFADKDVNPFFWLGDTGWRTFAGPTKEQVSKYFSIRKEQGFNVIMAFYSMSWAMANCNQDSAFYNLDPLKPNSDYLNFVKWCVNEANKHNLNMLIILGEPFRNDTRYNMIDDEDLAYQYSHQLVSELKDFNNIIWALAQDFQGVRNSLWLALAEGIHDAIDGEFNRNGNANWDNALVSYHVGWEASSSLYVHNEPWLDFNMQQSSHTRRDSHHTYSLSWMDWTIAPPKPTFDSEPCYEGHSIWMWADGDHFTEYDVRKAVYRSVFAGGCGVSYGANGVWQLNNPDESLPVGDEWLECLQFPGAKQMVHLKKLMLSRPYFERIPDKNIILSVNPNKKGKIIATSSSKGDYAMVYVPCSGQEFNLDASKLKGEALKSWWYSPLDGKTYSEKGQPMDKPVIKQKSNKMNIVSPDFEGSKDWVLV